MTVYIDNEKLMKRIHKIMHETTVSKEHAIRTGVEEHVLRMTFGVKSFEFDDINKTEFDSYDRKQVITNEQIVKLFMHYIEVYINLPHYRIEYFIGIKTLIESVEFFNSSLGYELKEILNKSEIKGDFGLTI